MTNTQTREGNEMRIDGNATSTDILRSPADSPSAAVLSLPGVTADATDQYELLRAIRQIDAYCAELSAIRTVHAQNMCRVANHLQAGDTETWGHKVSLESVFND